MWFLFLNSLLFSVISPPDIHIDSYSENSLSFTLTMDSDIKVMLKFQTSSWMGLDFVWELIQQSPVRLRKINDIV